MISVIGLGDCGCNLTQKFSVYPQYKAYYINTIGGYSGHKAHIFPKHSSAEENEEKCPDLSGFFDDVDEKVLFIIGGSSHISAASLRLLSYIQDKEITILYIRPDVEFLSQTKKLIENSTFHILQEYARSAVFERIFLVENASLESIIDNLTIANFYDRINDYMIPIIHMVNVFDNTEPIMTSFSALAPASRVCTYGILDIESSEEKMFFPLDNITEKRYYFGVSEKTLKTDDSLLKKIKGYIRTIPESIRSSFSIYSTSYEDNFAYIVYCTSEIQTKENHARIE
tara:strand:- start:2282 stop:3136 length:855 start_codon:yes stop_codon:yes gene_type:complete